MMHNYTDDYYFITYQESDNRPMLGPDEDTINLRFLNENVTSNGRRPLIFNNVAATVYPKSKFKSIPPDIIFYGSDIAADDKIYKKIVELDIPNLILQPSIYINEKDVWYENYWFFTFTNKLDCWSRKNSEYDTTSIEMNGKDFFSIYSYQLDSSILDAIPLKDRLLFKMGADLNAFIVVHKSIASIFSTDNLDSAVLVPVKEYGVSFFH